VIDMCIVEDHYFVKPHILTAELRLLSKNTLFHEGGI
jgi:hypothetical protein